MTDDRKAQTADKYIIRFPDGMRDEIAAAAKANGRSMNAEIIAKLDENLRNSAQTDTVLGALASAVDEQKHLAEVYRLILARVGRIIEAAAHDLRLDLDVLREIQTLLILVGDRLQRGRLSTISDVLREADEISSQFTMAKTKLAHLEAMSSRGTGGKQDTPEK